MSINSENNNHPVWIKVIARTGYVAKGAIYFLIGLLAFQIAIGIGGQTSGATHSLKKFVYKPFGTAVLILCLIGFLAHASWKIINGFLDIEAIGSAFSDILFRGVEVIIGLVYLGMSYAALQILLGNGAKSSDKSTQIWIARVLTWPLGTWIVYATAAVVMLIGCYQFYTVYTGRFDYKFDIDRMSSFQQKSLRQLGRIGLIAWGIVYFMIAFLLYRAAQNANPQEAGGLGDALSTLAQQPYGAWILGITSGGLIIYGIYLLILSYYHEIYR